MRIVRRPLVGRPGPENRRFARIVDAENAARHLIPAVVFLRIARIPRTARIVHRSRQYAVDHFYTVVDMRREVEQTAVDEHVAVVGELSVDRHAVRIARVLHAQFDLFARTVGDGIPGLEFAAVEIRRGLIDLDSGGKSRELLPGPFQIDRGERLAVERRRRFIGIVHLRIGDDESPEMVGYAVFQPGVGDDLHQGGPVRRLLRTVLVIVLDSGPARRVPADAVTVAVVHGVGSHPVGYRDAGRIGFGVAREGVVRIRKRSGVGLVFIRAPSGQQYAA